MALAIGQIKLSSGTIVSIPIVPFPGADWEEITRSATILAIYDVNNNVITKEGGLSDDDLLEFYSLIYNYELNSFQDTASPNTHHVKELRIAIWYENSSGNYVLQLTKRANQNNVRYLEKGIGTTIYTSATDISGSNIVPKSYNDNGVAGNGTTDYPYINTTFAGLKLDVVARSRHITGNFNYPSNTINIYFERSGTTNTVTSLIEDTSTAISYDTVLNNITTYATNNNLDIGINTYDSDNPYAYQEATFGGGNGSMLSFNPDGVDPALVPSLPTLSASNIGFMSVYNPSASNLRALSQFLWSSAFDIDSFKKLFSDPMQCIIGLGVVPVRPTIGGSKNVTFGDIDSGISMSYISSEYVEKDMGSVSIDLLYGSFMDYNNTSIQIYLPYIGFRQLQPDDIIGGSIGVVYHINVIDGGCTAYIRHSSRGVLYQYSGSCIANIPLSAINYSGAIQNAVSAALNGVGVIAGIATGAAPVSVMGAAGLVSNAANLALNSKGQVQRSGNVSGSSGLMGIQRPYIIIERARISVPHDMNKFVGNTTNVTMSLNDCSGFTIIDNIRMQDFSCTNDEKAELESILHKGVIF